MQKEAYILDTPCVVLREQTEWVETLNGNHSVLAHIDEKDILDKVKYLGQEYFIKGRMSSGFAILMNIFNDKIDFSHLPKGWKTPKLSNLKRISARRSCLCTSQRI